MAQLYGKQSESGQPKALECTPEGRLKVDFDVTDCIHDSVTLVAANTEYSYAIPDNTRKITFRTVDNTLLNPGSDLRYAFVTGKVATPVLPFMMLDGGAVFSERELNFADKTLYFAGVAAGNIVLIEIWVT